MTDEFLAEIKDLEQRIRNLEIADAPQLVIDEFRDQLRNLRRLYQATVELYAAGEEDRSLQKRLHYLGFGDWTFANVYSFVYERTFDADVERESLVHLIGTTNYENLLRSGNHAGKDPTYHTDA